MLEKSWEQIATDLVNVSDDELEFEVAKIIEAQKIDMNEKANVYIGWDTRYHSPQLSRAVVNGVIALKGNSREYGIVTTPMLHYFVYSNNVVGAKEATESVYINKLVSAFKQLRGDKLDNGNYKNCLLFDGANGVGSLKMLAFKKRLGESLNCQVFNSNGKINYQCGADYVKTSQKPPIGLPADVEPNTRFCSVDGDADRLIYFFIDENGQFHLLDGDRIATLVADYLMDLVKKCGVSLKLGIVQTAYANGASTDYIVDNLKVDVACTPTGVKHLHHKALEYDIGVYFEANGHGTVVFSKNAKELIAESAKGSSSSDDQKSASKKLLLTIDVINETVGDAISDMLLVETILHAKGWNLKDWLATYDDLPNLIEKVKVQDRNVFETTDAERICVKPEGLQDKINELVKKYKRGRSFVRPSGTEDVVRVYAEAANSSDAKALAAEVSLLVYEMANGVGDKPVIPTAQL
jgi:phosphoacetylglucosamine mutase